MLLEESFGNLMGQGYRKNNHDIAKKEICAGAKHAKFDQK